MPYPLDETDIAEVYLKAANRAESADRDHDRDAADPAQLKRDAHCASAQHVGSSFTSRAWVLATCQCPRRRGSDYQRQN